MKIVPETFEEEMGLRLQTLRKSLGFKQPAAAEACDICQSAYSRLERGQTDMTVRHIRRLAALFQMTPVKLFACLTERT